MRNNLKLILLIVLILVTCIYISLSDFSWSDTDSNVDYDNALSHLKPLSNYSKDNNVWFIFTKVNERRDQVKKLNNVLLSLLGYSSVSLTVHLIVDQISSDISRGVVSKVCNFTGKDVQVKLYDIEDVTSKMEDIVASMKPHFSAKSGTYYSDSLFYVSLGLHRVAPVQMTRAIILDIDLQFEDDIALLFDEFKSFSETNLFGLAPELAPVYYHLLSTFRTRNAHRQLNVGLPCCARLPLSSFDVNKSSPLNSGIVSVSDSTDHFEGLTSGWGRPGLNSGVVLIRLDRVRSSRLFQTVTADEFVMSLTEKYMFKGHLGDQDFYSLLSWELPLMVHTLDCGWNRQLCTWWKDHGYHHIHAAFAYCPNKTRLYHANCNSRFPT